MSDVTQVLSAIKNGSPQAAEHLLLLIYEELRKLAVAKMTQEKPGQTLQATALVHEAYIRLVSGKGADCRDSRGHFFAAAAAAAAEAVRRILVEQARRKLGPEAGGGHQRVDLSVIDAESPGPQVDLLALSDSIDKLHAKDPRAADVVKLRFFAGLTRQQVANALGMSVATVDNDWAYAKGWLRIELAGISRHE